MQLLDKINSPDDIKNLDIQQLEQLSHEIREFLIDSVSKTGGHLASNLGAVELTLAIHKVFSIPNDKLVFDVGHQCYTHKILTGRKDKFDTLRQFNGISGFPKTYESSSDAFVAGHSSNSISAALGIATAFSLQHKDNTAVCVIGDGSFTGGEAYEAINNAGRSNSRLVIILNHNEMSISKNVGGFSRYLTSIRAKPWYLKLKSGTEKVLDHTPIIGKPIKHWLESSKSLLKTLIYRSTFFEFMGFSFLGPVNGHNFKELLDVLNRAKDLKKPVVIQVETIKGKGYPPAQQNPGEYHSTGAFDRNIGIIPKPLDNYSDQAGKYLVELANQNDKICAITAAMKYGTGLNHFSKAYKERFFDVGIAEQHAVTFAGGLASQGLIPVFAVYSSFLQRSYDQVLHDLAIDNQHVCLLIDRAGIVGEDGETHQGIFDVAMLSNIPNVTIYSPEGYDELKLCMQQAILKDNGIACVRYPRGKSEKKHDFPANTEFYYIDKKEKSLIISYGRLFSNCINCKASLLKLTKIHPIPKETIEIAMQYDDILFVEEGIKQGSVAATFGLSLLENGYKGNYKINAINNFVRHGKVSKLMEELKLDEKSIIERDF